jgi:hypothetical protein
MRLLVNNKATESNTTVNGVTTAFPTANMYNNVLIEKTYFEDYIDIDLGSAKLITAIGIQSSDINYALLAGSSDLSSNLPEYTAYLTDNVKFINETYRYWRLIPVTTTGIDYTSSGTDVSLTSPTGAYNTPSNYIPMENGSGIDCLIGDHRWGTGGSAGFFGAYGSLVTGTVYGTVKFSVPDANNWTNFGSTDGPKRFTLPRLANGDSLGGFFDYYYHQASWTYAFNGNQTDVIIAQNGSVFKTSISDSNLVVRWDGQTGPAGSATPDVTGDNTVTGGDDKINYFYLGEYLQMPAADTGSEPNRNVTDITNISSSDVILTTPGIVFKTQSFNFTATTKTEYDDFNTWYYTTDRANNVFFVQFENDMDIVPPFFSKITSYVVENRGATSYDWNITIQEAK